MIRRLEAEFRCRKFTLVELIVVLVIIALLTGLAVSSLRSESPASQMNRQALALEAWCAAVRYRCAEEGRDYVIRFLPETKFLYACIPAEEGSEEPEPPESGALRLDFPEGFEISTVEGAELEAREKEYVELFRFFPGGGGVCLNRPVLKLDNRNKYFDLTFLSGQLRSHDGDGHEAEANR